MAEIRLGVAPIAWMNDDLPELGGDIPVERCLQEARAAGYGGIEKSGRFPEDPERLRDLLAEYGLVLVTGWFSGELCRLGLEEEQRRIAAHLDLLQRLGCSVLVYAETSGSVQGRIDVPLSRRPRMPEEEVPRYGERLTRLAEWLQGHGLALSFHYHMGTMVERAEEVDRLFAHSGEAVGLLWDTGHAVFAGADPLALARRWAGRINHVHCKNVRAQVLERARAEDWSFLRAVREGVFTVPGDPEGMLDFAPVARLLFAAGYEGWVVVEAEQDPAKADPLRYARMGRETMARVLGEAGYRVR